MAARDLIGLLADNGIRLRRIEPGRVEQIVCPKCRGGKTGEKSLSVKVDEDGQGAAWNCKRATCPGNKGGVRVVENLDNWRRSEPAREPRKPPPDPEQPDRPEWFWRFWADRRIGAKVVEELGIYAQTRNFPPPIGRSPCFVFPYRWRGETRNHKYRPHPAKSPQQQDPDALATFYNADAIQYAIDNDLPLYWVEGEPDVAAMIECGFRTTISLKDGAPKEAKFRDGDKRFAAFETHAEELEKIKKHYIATDMDEPGRALSEELARRVGRNKAIMVEWPDGCKDACDVLAGPGLEVVQDAIARAEPYPIDGIFSIDEEAIFASLDAPPPPTLTTGTMATDTILKLPAEGRLIILTGYANQGKTTFSRFIMQHHIRKHGRKWLVFSPEHAPPERFFRELVECYVGKPIRRNANGGLPVMTREELADALVRLKPNAKMIANDGVDKPPSLDWLLERATAVVLRDGITDFMIDPWNEVDQDRGGVSETDFIGRSLQRLRGWANRHGCNVWVCPHPAKPPYLRNGEERRPPEGYDISGSAHWVNKPDLGLTIWTPSPGISELLIWKSKDSVVWGRKGSSAKMEFNEYTRQYTSYAEVIAPEETSEAPDGE